MPHSAEPITQALDMIRFGEYMHSLHVPTNLNLVKMKPLRGTGIVMFEPGSHVRLGIEPTQLRYLSH